MWPKLSSQANIIIDNRAQIMAGFKGKGGGLESRAPGLLPSKSGPATGISLKFVSLEGCTYIA